MTLGDLSKLLCTRIVLVKRVDHLSTDYCRRAWGPIHLDQLQLIIVLITALLFVKGAVVGSTQHTLEEDSEVAVLTIDYSIYLFPLDFGQLTCQGYTDQRLLDDLSVIVLCEGLLGCNLWRLGRLGCPTGRAPR